MYLFLHTLPSTHHCHVIIHSLHSSFLLAEQSVDEFLLVSDKMFELVLDSVNYPVFPVNGLVLGLPLQNN